MDRDQRRFPPSKRKLREARERGEVPFTPIVGAAATTATGAAVLLARRRETAAALTNFFEALWSPSAINGALDHEGALSRALDLGAALLGLPLAAIVVVGVFASVLQTGPLWSWRAVRTDLDRLSISRGIERILRGQWLERSVGVVFAALFVAIAASVWLEAAPGLFGRVNFDATRSATAIGIVVEAFLLRSALVLAAVAAVSVAYTRFRYFREQRMTRREVLDEQRSAEGDPRLRHHRRKRHRELSRSLSPEAAATAARLVLIAPGLAVAIHWDDKGSSGPRIAFVARGRRTVGRMVDAATPAQLVEDAALGSSLARARVGAEAPRATWRELAAHLARSQ